MPSRRGFLAACLGLLGLPAAAGKAEPEVPGDAVSCCCGWAEPESYTITISDCTPDCVCTVRGNVYHGFFTDELMNDAVLLRSESERQIEAALTEEFARRL